VAFLLAFTVYFKEHFYFSKASSSQKAYKRNGKFGWQLTKPTKVFKTNRQPFL
jgi:hypothetical protein